MPWSWPPPLPWIISSGVPSPACCTSIGPQRVSTSAALRRALGGQRQIALEAASGPPAPRRG
jgi:hypothetical protein